MANFYAVILVVHLICAVALVILVLIQPSEAGGFMGTGSMSNLMAPRRTADVMTRLTTIMAGCFFATSLFLAISANHHPAARSILDVDTGTLPAKQGVTAPATGPDSLKDKAPIRTGNDAADKKSPDQKTSGHKADQDSSDNEDSGSTKAQDKNSGDHKDSGKTGAPKAPETE